MVFVSSDKDMSQFQEYFATMPWLAIPPGDKRKGALSTRYEVPHIRSTHAARSVGQRRAGQRT